MITTRERGSFGPAMHVCLGRDPSCRAAYLKRLENLIDDVLLVNVHKNVCTDDSMQVRLHVVEREVNVTIVVGLVACVCARACGCSARKSVSG